MIYANSYQINAHSRVNQLSMKVTSANQKVEDGTKRTGLAGSCWHYVGEF